MREPWTQGDIDFALANHRTMSHAEIGKCIGRSANAVRNCVSRYAGQTLTHDERTRDVILRHWADKKPGQIASIARVTARDVVAIAADLGLTPKPLGTVCSLRPRGYSEREIIWARMNQSDPEARLILGHHEDPAAMRAVG